MFDLKVGQELEFIEPANIEERLIPKGTRARVGNIMTELVEDNVTLLLHGKTPPEVITLARHFVTLHCKVLSEPA